MASSRIFRALVLVLRLLLGGVFTFAAWVKLKDPISRALFAIDLDAYKIIPLRYVQTVAWVLPVAEMVAGVLLILSAIGFLLRPQNRAAVLCLRLSSVLVCLSLVVFIGAMSWAKLSGKNIDCGCFGPGEPISWKTMVRDGSMLAAAVFVAWTSFLSRRKTA
jgi:uncharacterized membrane protein YphA (DoxX/SURF4 family)